MTAAVDNLVEYITIDICMERTKQNLIENVYICELCMDLWMSIDNLF